MDSFYLLLLLSCFSCVRLCNPIDGSPPGSPVPGILQARTLEWVASSFSNAWKWKVKVKSLSRVWLVATPWTAAYQAPLSIGFSRQEYWSGVPLPSPIWRMVKVKRKKSMKSMIPGNNNKKIWQGRELWSTLTHKLILSCSPWLSSSSFQKSMACLCISGH